MFRKLRITLLLYLLVLVGLGQYMTLAASTSWQRSLWVDIYLVNADGARTTQSFLDGLTSESFAPIEDFFAAEAGRYDVGLAEPLRIELAGQLDRPLGGSPGNSVLSTLWWSLRMRWFVTRLHWRDDRPTPDITLFVNYHEAAGGGIGLDRSTALRKGMIAVANVFAEKQMTGSNQVIMAHELLHTLRASDKYDPQTTLPLFPLGYADPDAEPRHPQTRAELMGGRIAVSPREASIPRSLRAVVIGPLTANEIGWTDD